MNSQDGTASLALRTYLIEVDHHITLQPSATLDILQGQREVDPSSIRYIKVVGIVLVPLLNSCKHLILIRADNVHILGKEHRAMSL